MGASANLTEGAVPDRERVSFDALVEIDARLDNMLFVGFPAVREEARDEVIDGETEDERASGGRERCAIEITRSVVGFSGHTIRAALSALLQDRGMTLPSSELRLLSSPCLSSCAQSRRWIHLD